MAAGGGRAAAGRKADCGRGGRGRRSRRCSRADAAGCGSRSRPGPGRASGRHPASTSTGESESRSDSERVARAEPGRRRWPGPCWPPAAPSAAGRAAPRPAGDTSPWPCARSRSVAPVSGSVAAGRAPCAVATAGLRTARTRGGISAAAAREAACATHEAGPGPRPAPPGGHQARPTARGQLSGPSRARLGWRRALSARCVDGAAAVLRAIEAEQGMSGTRLLRQTKVVARPTRRGGGRVLLAGPVVLRRRIWRRRAGQPEPVRHLRLGCRRSASGAGAGSSGALGRPSAVRGTPFHFGFRLQSLAAPAPRPQSPWSQSRRREPRAAGRAPSGLPSPSSPPLTVGGPPRQLGRGSASSHLTRVGCCSRMARRFGWGSDIW